MDRTRHWKAWSKVETMDQSNYARWTFLSLTLLLAHIKKMLIIRSSTYGRQNLSLFYTRLRSVLYILAYDNA